MKAIRAALASWILLPALFAVACGAPEEEATAGGSADVTRGLLDSRPEAAVDRRTGPVREVPVDDLGFDYGTTGAPVRVLEMSDFGCGYCRQFHLETWPTLREEFVEDGRVEWKFVPYVTGMFDNSLAATRAAECALEQSEEAFEALGERIWRDQREWKGSGDAAALIRGWAVEEGVDAAPYDTCLAEGRRFDRVAAGGRLARELGVRGTPTFFVIGYPPLQGALPLETFRQVLTAVHAQETQGSN